MLNKTNSIEGAPSSEQRVKHSCWLWEKIFCDHA